MTKIEWVQHRLKTAGYITGLQAINEGNYYRLSDGILKLRKRGWQIATENVHTKTSQFGRYWLIDERLTKWMAANNKELREIKGVWYVVDEE